MRDELYTFIKKNVAKLAEKPISQINDKDLLQDDLEIDSLSSVEILHKIEKKYKIKISDPELPSIKTVFDLYIFCKQTIEQSKKI